MSFEFHIIRFSLKLRLVKINNKDGLELKRFHWEKLGFQIEQAMNIELFMYLSRKTKITFYVDFLNFKIFYASGNSWSIKEIITLK